MHMDRGSIAAAAVEQFGVDLVLSVVDPEGEVIALDRLIDDTGPEKLVAVAERTGIYRLILRAPESKRPPGRYRLKARWGTTASKSERNVARGVKLLAGGQELFGKRNYAGALELFQQAERLVAETDPFWAGEINWWTGKAFRRLDRLPEAVESLRRASKSFSRAGEGWGEAFSTSELGAVFFGLAKLKEAKTAHRRALSLHQARGDRRGEALALQELAQVYQADDAIDRALEHYAQAFDLWGEMGDRKYQTLAQHNVGSLYLSLGDLERAEEHLLRAVSLASENDNAQRTLAASRNRLGDLYLRRGDVDRAKGAYESALELRRSHGNRYGEAIVLRQLGRLARVEGDSERAAALFRRSTGITKEIGRKRTTAVGLLDLGGSLLNDGWFEESRSAFEETMGLCEEVGDETCAAHAALGGARAALGQSEFDLALRWSESALGHLETLRPRVPLESLKATFFAEAQPFYDFHIDLLMDLRRAEGDFCKSSSGL